MSMSKKIIVMSVVALLAIGLAAPVRAATEGEIIDQVETMFRTINPDFADALIAIANMAKGALANGDTEGNVNYREALRDAVTEACATGDSQTVTTPGCDVLVPMVQ